MTRTLATLLSALLLAGCFVSEARHREAADHWKGAPETLLVRVFGKPDTTRETDDARYLTWVRDRAPIHPGTPEQPIAPGHRHYCATTFTVSEGHVTDWKSSGNYCVARSTAPSKIAFDR